jgi:hypothetical protein
MLDFRIGALGGTAFDDDDTLGVQVRLDGPGGGAASAFGQFFQPSGFFSRPLDPGKDALGKLDPTKTPEVLYFYDGPILRAMPLADPRTTPGIPALQKGEAAVHSASGAFTRASIDGSVVAWTSSKGGDPSGASIFSLISPTQFQRVAPWGKETWNASYYRLVTHAGASVTINSISGLPGPLSAISTMMKLEADMVRISGKIVVIGGDPGSAAAQGASPPSSATKYDQLLPVLQSIAASLETIATAISTAAPSSGITAANILAAQTAVGLAKAALTAATTEGPAVMKSTVVVG